MRFLESELEGVFIVQIEPHCDERGFFARTWCAEEFVDHGLANVTAQASISYNKKKGTLRGMHYSVLPANETKLVRCTSGEIYDVVIDLRPWSATYLKHLAITLSETNHSALYIPPGFAHGFQTMADDTEVFYMMNDPYKPNCGRGVRWNDPVFGIKWPEAERIIHERDNTYADFHSAVTDELVQYRL